MTRSETGKLTEASDTPTGSPAQSPRHFAARNDPPLTREELLRRFATTLAAAHASEQRLLDAAVNACTDLLQAEQASIWLVDSHGIRLVLRAQKGYADTALSPESTPSYSLDPSEPSITTWIYHNQETVHANSFAELRLHAGYRGKHDVALHNWQDPKSDPAKHPCQQFYGGPISLGDDHFGVLKVENKKSPSADGRRRFTPDDQES